MQIGEDYVKLDNSLGFRATEKGGILGEGETKEQLISKTTNENIAGSYIPPRAKTLEDLLQYTTVEHLLTNHGTLHSVLSTDTIETTLQWMREYNIQAVPVYSNNDKSKFLGLVDSADILEYLFSLGKQQVQDHFFQKQICELIEISKFNPTPMVPVGTSLMQVLQILEKGETHRVGVIDPSSGSLYSVISQMLLTQFIAKNISLMDQDLRDKPVSEIMKQISQVENIPSDTSTNSAFHYLNMRQISAAAIVQYETGKVVDTLSTSDVVGFLYDKFKYLDEDVVKFLCATRRTKALKPPIGCRVNDTLEYCILKLASTQVHRLWVMGDDNLYLGLVNLTNVLHTLAFAYLETMD